MRYEMMEINGVRLNVGFAGDGNGGIPVLMVHGFPDDNTVWRHQIPALVAAGHRVIAPDTRGCGESEMLERSSDYSLDHLVADLVQLLDSLKIPIVKLVSHDWGSVISWHFAMSHPDRIDRFVTLSVGHPYCYAHAGVRQKLSGAYAFLFYLFRDVAAWAFKLGDWAWFRAYADMREEWPHAKARLSRPGRFRAGMNYYIANVPRVLRVKPVPVQVPVMGVWSDDDHYLVEKQMVDSARLVTKEWTYRRVEGAYHWMQLDKPREVTRLILDYLTGEV